MNERCQNVAKLEVNFNGVKYPSFVCLANGEPVRCSGMKALCEFPILFKSIYGVKERRENGNRT